MKDLQVVVHTGTVVGNEKDGKRTDRDIQNIPARRPPCQGPSRIFWMSLFFPSDKYDVNKALAATSAHSRQLNPATAPRRRGLIFLRA